ncbi:MAG: hypothetical protein ACP5GI_03685 [Sulfolobales archaeon]
MSNKSSRLLLARVLVEINKSLAELKIIREKILRRITIDTDQEMILGNMLKKTNNYIFSLERLSERIQTILSLDPTLSNLSELYSLRKELRELEKELREFNSLSALGLRKALEELDKFRYETL